MNTMAKTYRDRIGDLLDLIRSPLASYIKSKLEDRYNDTWRQAAEEILGPNVAVERSKNPDDWDVLVWMHVLLGGWNDLFSHVLSPGHRSYLYELKDIRNEWAHQKPLSFDNTYRAYDNAELFLSAINSPFAEKVKELKEQLQYEHFAKPAKRKVVKIKTDPKSSLQPWRSIIAPHPDVREGRFSQAEFAADLWEVQKAVMGEPGVKGKPEYTKPKEFFSRTYITQGLGQLLSTGLSRLSNAGGEPIVRLQTNFGGGKTHSMLALYHLLSGEEPIHLPGIDAFLVENNLSVPNNVRRVVLVGNKISPGEIHDKEDGTEVRTLWGEIAWQLGGKKGYELVKASDETGTNPGDSLSQLFSQYAPLVIFFDEWVAYARQLFDRKTRLPAGDFDTQFTFAQTLTEEVKNAEQCLLVLSLPQSEDELGSEGGQDALQRLGTAVGRIESTWQPATEFEAYEIVRRRLFDANMDTKARGEVIRAYRELYKDNSQYFPLYVQEEEYLRKLERTYPIHPSLFEHLYNAWSTIPRFQQTRGVLRLIAATIHSLWANQDSSVMIMPGTVPLDDPNVRSEFTKFLGPVWNNIIDAEIDGENSIATLTDKENVNLGKLGAARRAARTLFLATSPLQKASHLGVDERAVKTGCTQPGETPATFADAVEHIAKRSVYLYSEEGRYWYSEQPTLRKLAEDRKVGFDVTHIYDILEKQLAKSPKAKEKSDFSRIHISPHSASEVGDQQQVGLVILSPEEHHTAGQKNSPAVTRATSLLDSRGTGPRLNKNMLVFAAADQTRLKDLEEAVRSWIAWGDILHDAEQGKIEVTTGQMNSARSEKEEAFHQIQARIPETYRWLLIPEQQDPQSQITIEEYTIKGDKAIAQKAAEYMHRIEQLIPVMDGPRLRLEIDQIPLWKNNTVSLNALVEYFSRYVYLPRIASRDTIIHAIEDGVSNITWNADTFAIASGYNKETGKFSNLKAGEQINVASMPEALLVQPKIAQDQIDKEKAEKKIESAAGEGEESEQNETGTGKSTSTKNEKVGVKPEQTKKKRFYGTVDLDPFAPSGKMGTIVEELLVHLTTSNASVKVHLEIEADSTEGFSEETINTVMENAQTLGFEQKGFEEE
jgi:hypothetical protein